MSNNDFVYELIEKQSKDSLEFLFVSSGSVKTDKLIRYSYYDQFQGHKLFNLGFGDFNQNNHSINDKVISNNNDTYKIFNTVLKSIPLFFEKHPKDYIIVRGSDSNNLFESQCRITCTKKCKDVCKNKNRRINIYKKYIDKNYDTLHATYEFLGGVPLYTNEIIFEKLVLNKNYVAIIVSRNIFNFKS